MNNNDLVLKILNDNNVPMRAGEIAEKSGLEKKEVEKAIKNLVAETKAFSPKRCFYEIKK